MSTSDDDVTCHFTTIICNLQHNMQALSLYLWQYVPWFQLPAVGVQDGTSKMSKSAELDASRINLLDDPKLIQQKVKRAKTDTFEGLEWGNPDRPEATNLLGIYSLCTGISMVSLCPSSVSNRHLPVGLSSFSLPLALCQLPIYLSPLHTRSSGVRHCLLNRAVHGQYL